MAFIYFLKESLARSHGSQCGFCTPGFIMSLYALLRSSQTPPTEEQIEESLAGNLCRCTGYRPIIDAFRVFAKTNDALYADISSLSLQEGEFVCPSTGKPCSCGSKTVNDTDTNGQSICSTTYKPVFSSEVDGSTYTDKELIFPPEHASTGTLNERSDACSFGIPLVGVISGRNPVDDTSRRDKFG